MGFNKFTWIDRDAEYLDRRTIIDTSTGASQLVTMTRNEGAVFEQGTPFSEVNMNSLEGRIDEMFPVSINNIKKSDLLDYIYPVGSIYMSVSEKNPSILFGGTWEQIQDRFLLASGSTYTAGATGGTVSHTHTTGNHTLTINEIPNHKHFALNRNDGGSTDQWSYSTTYGKALWETNMTGDVSGSTGQSHNHGNTGQASNLPPYLTVYVFKRTA